LSEPLQKIAGACLPSGAEAQSWVTAPAEPALAADEVHVWRASLERNDTTVQALERLLTAEERQRAQRFVFNRDQRRFVIARGLLRTILSRYLQRDPVRIQFSYGEHGKPFVDGANIFFNLSHSNTMALYAVSAGRQLGVDVEHIRRDLDARAIATRFFSRAEVAALNDLPDEAQIDAFFNCWARKEAYIKARGEGIYFGLDKFDVSLSPGEAAALLRVEGDPNEISRWTFRSLRVHPDYAAAVAAEGGDWQLRCWEFGAA
jgi:4'-phosphopantetheinyl transferase